jgi:hypothetical protein
VVSAVEVRGAVDEEEGGHFSVVPHHSPQLQNEFFKRTAGFQSLTGPPWRSRQASQ